MTVLPDSRDVDRFRTIVARRMGLQFEDGKLGFLAEVLRRRLQAIRQPCEAYLAGLETNSAREELGALAQELTVAETYFFRNIDQFRALSEVALPERMEARKNSRRLQIVSAGCASGEEAYSIAIAAREVILDPSWEISILGVDVNPAQLKKALRGTFSSWALRETPPDTRHRWFRPEGRDLVLDESIRASVTFQERNLADANADLWQPDTYDIVFCRNVIMYLTLPTAQALVKNIAGALAPGGYLFLGHAETLRGVSHDFHLCHTHDTFYYQRKQHAAQALQGVVSAERARSAPPAGDVEALVCGADSWVEAIRRAGERIQRLAELPPSDTTTSHTAAGAPGWDLGSAFQLLQQERFTDALHLVRALPSRSLHDPDVLLLHAVLLTHGGQLVAAEDMCRRLLGLDELNAGAHYVLALCREGAGDRHGAVAHDQVAAYLDPVFAMPRLHLGLLARRGGTQDVARRELSQALVLLEREDASRLLLFGGGFGRDALIALCRSELVACGGRT